MTGRLRAWWDSSTLLADVSLAFAAVTVVNSAMMLTGWDEPKTGSFTYTYLLSRLGIVTVVVGLFHLDDLRGSLDDLRRMPQRWRQARQGTAENRRGWPNRWRDAVLGSVARAPVTTAAYAFTAVVATTCGAALALAGLGAHAPAGGEALYRNLLVLAAVLVVATSAGAWWLRRHSNRCDDPTR